MTERRRKPAGVAMAALALATSLAAAAADERIITRLDIEQPRSFGYHIGDRFSRDIKLELRAPYVLDTKALPAAGRFSEFLTLDTPRITSSARDGATSYDIRFDYQVVNVGLEAASIAVPHHDLQYSNGQEVLKALIPDTRITVTPLRAKDDATLAANTAPARRVFDATALWACATSLVLSVLGLVFMHGRLPSWRRARPFMLAFDEVRAAQRRGWRDEDYTAALRAVHRAFNATAGRTVFADALTEFFHEHPAYAGLHAPLTEFFARSRGFFFAPGVVDDERYSASELAALVKRCCDVERGLT